MYKKYLAFGIFVVVSILISIFSPEDVDTMPIIILLAGTCFIYFVYESLAEVNSTKKELKCRVCGKSENMAITYEIDGLCRKCLDDILPDSLKGKGDTEVNK
jgi:hypothetical protein